jgi:hypothetical protein
MTAVRTLVVCLLVSSVVWASPVTMEYSLWDGAVELCRSSVAGSCDPYLEGTQGVEIEPFDAGGTVLRPDQWETSVIGWASAWTFGAVNWTPYTLTVAQSYNQSFDYGWWQFEGGRVGETFVGGPVWSQSIPNGYASAGISLPLGGPDSPFFQRMFLGEFGVPYHIKGEVSAYSFITVGRAWDDGSGGVIPGMWYQGEYHGVLAGYRPIAYLPEQGAVCPGLEYCDGPSVALRIVPAAVPEPGSALLVSAGAAVVLWASRRRRM